MTTKRIVVGAHYGLRGWLAQRISAVVLAVYTVVLLVALVAGPPLSYDSWARLFGQGWMKVATLVALLAVLYHAWVGVRDIYMDYVKPTGIRLALQVITLVALLGYGCWAVLVLWRV